MTDHITLPRSVVEQAIEATGVLLRMIRRDAPYLSGKTMGIAETCNDALLGALAGAAQAEPMAWIRKPEAPTFYAPVLHLDSNPPTPLTKQEAIIAGWVPVVECTAPQPAQPVAVPQVKALFAAIEHGDEDHRAWLKQALEDFYAGREVQHPEQPPPAAPTPPAATVPVLEPLTDAQATMLLKQSELLDMFEHIGWYSAPRKEFMKNSLTLIRAVEAAHAAKLAKLNGITPPAEGSV